MKNISSYEEFVNESSIRQKKREVDFTKNYFRNNKKNYKGIASFGIITPENGDNKGLDIKTNKNNIDEFLKGLKRIRLRYVPIKGYYQDNEENSFIVFNISFNSLKYFAGKYEQESFFYCYTEEEETICEFWRKKDTTKKYHDIKNDYEFANKTNIYYTGDDFENYSIIGNDFKFNIDASVFDKINEKILENVNEYLKNYRKDDDIEKLLWECTNLKGSAYTSHIRYHIYTDKTSSEY